MKNNTRQLTTAALLLALGLVLPLITAQIPTIGALLSPMHLPVLIGGLILGPSYGLLLGVLTPFLRHIIFGMPPFPGYVFMVFELGMYGLISGLLINKVFKKEITYKNVYISLIIAMIAGRIMYGLVKLVFMKYILMTGDYTIALWIADTVTGSIAGIIIQLALIPYLVVTLNKRNIISK